VEQDILGELAAGRHGLLDPLYDPGIGVLSHQEEVILPQHLFPVIAAHLQESGVAVDDRIAVDVRVRNRHRHPGGVEGLYEGATQGGQVDNGAL
jgi:hypothetical protein